MAVVATGASLLLLPSAAVAVNGVPVDVGSNHAQSSTPSLTITTSQAVPAGASVIVTAVSKQNGFTDPNAVACSDNAGNTYHTDVTASNTLAFTSICSTQAIASGLPTGSMITVTWSGGLGMQNQVVRAFSVTGLAGSALDQTASASGSSTAPSSGLTGTTAQANELLFGAFGVSQTASGSGFSPGTNGTANDCASTGNPTYSSLGGIDVAGQAPSVLGSYCLVSTTGAYQAQATITSTVWYALVATYKTGASTTTGLGTSQNPATVGQAVTLTAAVAGASPTGTVNFEDGGTTIPGCGSEPVSAGVASCTTSGLALGSHSVIAVYGGDTFNQGSSSSQLTQTVNQAASTTSLGSSPNPSKLGQAVTFTVTVAGSSPTGTVNFEDGAATISGCGAQTLSGGVATCEISSLAAGAHGITATYGGDADNIGSTASTLTQTIEGLPSVSITSPTSGASFTQGQAVTASYSCRDGAGGPGISSCSGTVPNGQRVDTSTIGGRSFSVKAVSLDGQSATQTVSYTVASGASAVKLVGSAKSTRQGASFKLRCSAPAGQSCQTTDTLTTTETLNGGQPVALSAAHKPRKRKRTVVVGRKRATIPAGTTKTITITLNAQGRKLLKRFHKLPVTLALKLTSHGKTTQTLRRELTIKQTTKQHALQLRSSSERPATWPRGHQTPGRPGQA